MSSEPLRALKFDSQAKAVTAGRRNAGAGEQAGEIYDVQAVVEVLDVGLQAHEQVFSPHQFRAYRCPQRKRRPHPAPVKVHAIDNLLPELLNRVLMVPSNSVGKPLP